MHKSSVTLKDLARILGLSESTVSRALKDHPRISQRTKDRVKQLATDLAYTPNQLAVSLLKRHMNAIGVVVPNIGYHFYAMAISGMEAVAERHDMNIIICQSNESHAREESILKELLGSRVAGFIISLSSETQRYDHFARVKSRGVPLVFFNRQCLDVMADKVVIDNFGAARDAVNHLISVGCQRIAYLGGPPEVQISNRRLEGYQQALHLHSLPVDERLIRHTPFDPQSAKNAVRSLLYSHLPPDAILAFSDQLALHAMMVAKECGIRIPDELCLVGFNNEPVDLLMDPPLTSVSQPAYEMGARSVELLLEQLNTLGEYRKAQTVVLNSNLLIRGSTNRNKRQPPAN